MNNQTNQQRLLSVLFCSLSVVFGFSFCIDRTQGEIPANKPPQQGFGRAPNPNPTATPTSTKKPTQQGFGRAPNLDPTATPTPTTNTKKPPQQGFGRAPNPNLTKIYFKY